MLSLAHISDIHRFSAMPKGREWLSKRALSVLSWQYKRRHLHRRDVAERLMADLLEHNPGRIAVTGDVVNFGLEQEFLAARQCLDRLGGPERVIVMPGNHEAMCPGWRPVLAQHWADYLGPKPFEPRLYRAEKIALIAVSTAYATPPFMANGRVGKDALAILAERLASARGLGCLPVVLMHHPPTPVTSRRKGLDDRHAVSQVLAQGGAAMVLHGHTHRRDLSWIDGIYGRCPVLGVPALSMHAGARHDPGAWRLITFSASPRGWRAQIKERVITPDGTLSECTPFILDLPAKRRKSHWFSRGRVSA